MPPPPRNRRQDDRRQPETGRRTDDLDLERWRGQIAHQVDTHEREIEAIRNELKDMRGQIGNLGRSMIEMHERLDDLRADTQTIAEQLEAGRNDVLAELRGKLASAAQTKRDMFMGVTAPLIVAIILTVLLGHHV